MTRFAIDDSVALQLIRAGRFSPGEHSLVGPAVLRTDVLSRLYDLVRAGSLEERLALRQLEGLAELKIRLLGDRVSRSTAWKLASQLGWADVRPAEYLAVAKLQADVLVSDSDHLRRGAETVIPVATYRETFG